MSVLIKGVKMPNCCDDCWALDEYGDYPVCRITKEQRGYNFRIREKRMDKCPLVPVLPHGRLIDADALLEHMKKIHDKWKMEGHYTPTTDDEIMTMYMPTIIEAEEEQE